MLADRYKGKRLNSPNDLVCKSDGAVYFTDPPLDIKEYTDPHHNATVPHTLILSPGLKIEKSYVGYWFWGCPSAYHLWLDLGEVFSRTKEDFDPTLPEVRAAWEASH